jgi:hypothetical protein
MHTYLPRRRVCYEFQCQYVFLFLVPVNLLICPSLVLAERATCSSVCRRPSTPPLAERGKGDGLILILTRRKRNRTGDLPRRRHFDPQLFLSPTSFASCVCPSKLRSLYLTDIGTVFLGAVSCVSLTHCVCVCGSDCV